jgi:hypothetical protein
VTEIDSARVISSSDCEIIQKVEDVTEKVFKFGSTAPCAILFDARDQYDVGYPKFRENCQRLMKAFAAFAYF